MLHNLCWWLYDGDWFQMLVAESLCWRLFSLCWWISQCIKSVTNISNLSPATVTNIDVTAVLATKNLYFIIWPFFQWQSRLEFLYCHPHSRSVTKISLLTSHWHNFFSISCIFYNKIIFLGSKNDNLLKPIKDGRWYERFGSILREISKTNWNSSETSQRSRSSKSR